MSAGKLKTTASGQQGQNKAPPQGEALSRIERRSKALSETLRVFAISVTSLPKLFRLSKASLQLSPIYLGGEARFGLFPC